MHKCADLVDLDNCCKMSIENSNAKIGFDTAENEPYKLSGEGVLNGRDRGHRPATNCREPACGRTSRCRAEHSIEREDTLCTATPHLQVVAPLLGH